jgi:hypothetical protein
MGCATVFGRRLLILVAVLMGLTVLAAGVTPPPQPPPRPSSDASPTPAPGADETRADASVVSRRIDAGAAEAPARIALELGQTLELTVAVAAPDAVALGELDLEAADPASPAVFEWVADATGEYPIALVEGDRALGVVRVTR